MNSRSKLKFYLGLITCLVIVGIVILVNNNLQVKAEEDRANQKRFDIQILMEQWDIEQRSIDQKSSNPFDYINTPSFDKLSNLDVSYLPYMVEAIENEDSMATFGLTSAVITVSKSTEAKSFEYETPNEFVKVWKEFENSIPEKYERVKDGDTVNSETKRKIADLGALVIPLIIEDIDSNDDIRFAPVITMILEGEGAPPDNQLSTWKRWVKENRDHYKF